MQTVESSSQAPHLMMHSLLFRSWSSFGSAGLLSAFPAPYLLLGGSEPSQSLGGQRGISGEPAQIRDCCPEELTGCLKAKASWERSRAHVYRWDFLSGWEEGNVIWVAVCQPLKSKAGSHKTSCVEKSNQKSQKKTEQTPEVKLLRLEPL